MSRNVAPVALLLLTVVSPGCTTAREGEPSASDGVGRPVRFELVHRTISSCHGTDRQEAVIGDAASWAAWWEETACGGGERPVVDFQREMVLAVRDVEGPTGCYRVRVAELTTGVGGGYRVRVDRHVPEASTPCAMIVVHPAHAVKVPRVRGPVVFEWRTVTGPPPSVSPG